MAETPEFKLTDFPNEIIERLIPDDHEPKTISALKLVCKRFYDFLTKDIYYKCYLRFPEKNYLCEMKCETNSAKEEIDKIKRGDFGKWKGYLTLENIHLDNWRCGNVTRSTIVPLQALSDDFDGFNIDGVLWHQHIDEDNEHWLLNLRSDGSIVLLNITDNKPKMFVEREMYGVATECVRLLSGQVVCISYNMQHIVILNIVNDGDNISLQYNFDFAFDMLDFKWIFVTGKCGSAQTETNLFVFIREFPNVDGILRFRDLKTAKELENIRLWDYEVLKKYRDLPNLKLVLKFDESVEFPYIMLTIQDDHSGQSLVVVFNIEAMQATTFINMSTEFVIKCCISLNVAYIFSTSHNRDIESGKDVNVTNLHRLALKDHPNTEELKTPELLSEFYFKGLFDAVFSQHQTFAFKDHLSSNKVHIMSVTGTGVNDVQVDLGVDYDYTILNVVGPDVLTIQDIGNSNNISSFKVTGEKDGVAVKVIDWSKIFNENDIKFVDPCPILSLVDLSKAVFYDRNVQDKDCLAIFHF